MVATVLVVEDEAKLRQLLRDMLEREGLAVVTTGSGAEAIDVFYVHRNAGGRVTDPALQTQLRESVLSALGGVDR